MSYKENDGTNTTTIERPTTNILDLIDERMKQNSFEEKTEIEREVERFDNSHKAENLQRAYDEMDRQQIEREVSKPHQKKKFDSIQNPFFGDPDSLNKMRKHYADVVDTPKQSPTLEIKSYRRHGTVKSRKSDTRMKLWIGTGVVSMVLLLTLIVCNIFSIGAINRDIDTTQNGIYIQERELQELNASISNESGTIPEGMSGVSGAQSIDITPLKSTEIKTSDNIFNKIADFIAYLFGR